MEMTLMELKAELHAGRDQFPTSAAGPELFARALGE